MMSITSFSYFVFIAIAALVYYVLPKSLQWIELLAFSVLFYYMAGTPYTFLYIGVSAMLAWSTTYCLEKYRKIHGPLASNRLLDSMVAVSVIVNILLWFLLKGNSFIIDIFTLFDDTWLRSDDSEIFSFVAALGMGYYTLQVIAYTLDCYWGTVHAQGNPLKLLLFISFFPQMITGPISRYNDLASLYDTHAFKYINLTHGTQRIIWGLFKKLVVAERVGVIVNAVWADMTTYNGLYLWIAFLLYPIQMYADFSGCMDIVIGTAEIFDIRLTENFNNPFFSRTSQEFWQRWHISLGSWAKNYVLYPLLKSKYMLGLNNHLKAKYGKKTGKFITTALGMLVLWLVMGIWHGAFKYIVGVSLWYWSVLMIGDLITPKIDKLCIGLKFKTESFGWHFFQSVRTYFIYAVGAVFFRGDNITQGCVFAKSLIATFSSDHWNPWILFDGSILNLGITYNDLFIIMLSVIFMIIVAVLREKYGYARFWLDNQPIIFRWGIYIGLLLFLVLFGSYGPNYNADDFIYGAF